MGALSVVDDKHWEKYIFPLWQDNPIILFVYQELDLYQKKQKNGKGKSLLLKKDIFSEKKTLNIHPKHKNSLKTEK